MAESHESVRKFIEKMQTVLDKKCGCSLMVELQPSKLTVRVRFSSPAPNSQLTSFGMFFYIMKLKSYVVGDKEGYEMRFPVYL